MDISNRTLGLLLVAAIVVSIGSTFFMLNSITSAPGFTGYLTGTDSGSGDVKLNLSTVISINMASSLIDFGTCQLDVSGTYTQYNSSQTYPSSLCSGGSFTTEGYLMVESDGTVDFSLNVSTNASASDVYKDVSGASTPNSKYILYVANNESNSCSSGMLTGWNDFYNTSSLHLCDNLNYEDTTDSMKVYATIQIDNNAVGSTSGSSATWNFLAYY